jgi:hypothetical protein
MRRVVGWVVGLGVVVCAEACAAGDPFTGCGSGDAASTASDVVVTTNVEAALYFAVASAMAPDLFAMQGDQAPTAAGQAAAAASATFSPGCVTAAASGPTVTYQLDDCAGPLGLVHATGVVAAKIVDEGSDPGGEFLLQLSGDGVAGNGANLTLNTSGFFTQASSGERTLQAISMSSGTGPSGTSVVHSGTFTMQWSSGAVCATINASFSGVGASGPYGGAGEVLTGYVACRNSCPRAGLATSVFAQGSINLGYDGSGFAFCTASTGTSAALELECP